MALRGWIALRGRIDPFWPNIIDPHQIPILGMAVRVLSLAIDDWSKGHEIPDVVAGRIFSEHVFLRLENRGNERLHDVRLRVEGSAHVRTSRGPVTTLQPGQRSSVHAPLEHLVGGLVDPTACPLRLRLEVQAGSVTLVKKELRLNCRTRSDRFTFVYLDADGSPQIAAAKFPALPPAGLGTTCPERGCAVLLSTHGMDVTAQRQADCYAPKPGAWVLAPHGRGTHGFNWQGVRPSPHTSLDPPSRARAEPIVASVAARPLERAARTARPGRACGALARRRRGSGVPASGRLHGALQWRLRRLVLRHALP